MFITKSSIFGRLENGYVLGINRQQEDARLVRRFDPKPDEIPVDYDVALSCVIALHRLTRDGEPPKDERQPGQGYRLGYVELGLFDTHEWYTHVQ